MSGVDDGDIVRDGMTIVCDAGGDDKTVCASDTGDMFKCGWSGSCDGSARQSCFHLVAAGRV